MYSHRLGPDIEVAVERVGNEVGINLEENVHIVELKHICRFEGAQHAHSGGQLVVVVVVGGRRGGGERAGRRWDVPSCPVLHKNSDLAGAGLWACGVTNPSSCFSPHHLFPLAYLYLHTDVD